MQYVGLALGTVSKTWNSINPSTLSGAIDVVVVKQKSGKMNCSPFHVRFGKLSLLRPSHKGVHFFVNDKKIDVQMKLSDGGEAFFVFKTEENVPSSMITSPLLSPTGSPEGTAHWASDEEVDYLDINTATTLTATDLSTPCVREVFGQNQLNDEPLREPLAASTNSTPEGVTKILDSLSLETRPNKNATENYDGSDSAAEARANRGSTVMFSERSTTAMATMPSSLLSTTVDAALKSIPHVHAGNQVSHLKDEVVPSLPKHEDYDLGEISSTDTGDVSSRLGGDADPRSTGIENELAPADHDSTKGVNMLTGLTDDIPSDSSASLWKDDRIDSLVQRLGHISLPNLDDGKEVIMDVSGYKPDSQNTRVLESVVNEVLQRRNTPSQSPAAPRSPSMSPPMSQWFESAPSSPASVGSLRRSHYVKTLRLTSSILSTLGLRPGVNKMEFVVPSNKASLTANIHLWDVDTPVVVSDIDGTITKSDALGHVMTMIGRDWTHAGVGKLYMDISNNGYNIMYLTSRSAGQADATRSYLSSIEQDGYKLPSGPVILSPERTMAALHREVIMKKPEIFKISCLKDIAKLYGIEDGTPFYAGFGNRITDAIAYRTVGIPPTKIFTIDSSSNVRLEMLPVPSSYMQISDVVDQMFPPVGTRSYAAAESFNDASFWRSPLPALSDAESNDDFPSEDTQNVLDEEEEEDDYDDDYDSDSVYDMVETLETQC